MPREEPGAAFVTFNQDCTCLCVANSNGITVYSLETHKVVFAAPLGAIRWECCASSTCRLPTIWL